MSNMPVEIPDRVSTLELSQIWLYKALQRLEQELCAEDNQIDQEEIQGTQSEDEAAE